jgi:hypothetical protein
VRPFLFDFCSSPCVNSVSMAWKVRLLMKEKIELWPREGNSFETSREVKFALLIPKFSPENGSKVKGVTSYRCSSKETKRKKRAQL